ncbi:MAG: gfo/Idh/MocA family oxidoreductase [Spirochaetaceae bacterium]|nr:MAG: gfo/Idh/MocA family oxidoreductase [Spirochaetaceae bacterium]
MEPVRWGVLGVSSHYIRRVHLPTQGSTVSTITAIASRSGERAQNAASELGIAQAYPSYAELLADDSIEAVYIPLPNTEHLEWIKKAADAGKHVLCEKPLGMDSAEVEQAIAYTGAHGVLLMEAFMYRFHPLWTRAKQLVAFGEIGAVRAVHVTFFYDNPDPSNIRNIAELGGGGLRDIGCYAVSASRYLVGREPTRVLSAIVRDNEFGTDALSTGVLDFGDAHATFSVGTRSYPEQSVAVSGSSGSIVIDLPFNIYPDVPVGLRVTNKIGTREIMTGPADQYQLQFDAFSRAVRDGRSAPTAVHDALKNQKVVDALFRSENTGTWQSLE